MLKGYRLAPILVGSLAAEHADCGSGDGRKVGEKAAAEPAPTIAATRIVAVLILQFRVWVDAGKY